ncbi:hypothetical protein AA0111_g9067 [Alternaria arborescens]|uniref:hypothetical protein n=1 Tax=Alternaria arborescens TaxID=156630 RepID=UPI001075097A|nr:hypothetical protein AA0111_g9067 [Alternaria arborescens]RYO23856.1 hypothetical protein AA0111_g9067 [Alternaria arborescens]
MSIGSEASMAQITDKDDTSDGLWQHPNTQTANDGEQTKKDASGGDGAIAATPTQPRAPNATDATNADGESMKAEFVNQFQENLRLQVEAEKKAREATEEETKAADVENDTPEKGPENSDMVNSAIATHKKRVDCADGKAKKSTSAVKAQRNCADGVLGSMSDIEKAMFQLYEYIKAHNDSKKPLYMWATFGGYSSVNVALLDLHDKAIEFEEAHRLPVTNARILLSRATQISLAVSQMAVFCMGVMGDKVTSCIDEVEESDLSAEGKDKAKALITKELKKLLKTCAKATDQVYVALDLLRSSLHVEESSQNLDISIIKDLIAESTPRKSWLRSVTDVVLKTVMGAAVSIAAVQFYSTSGFDLALQTNPFGTHSQVMSLVQRAQAVTNLTGEIYSIKLEDLDQRYKELEAASESHGLRIDSLVEALGVPNAEGTYYLSMPKSDREAPGGTQKISADADRQIQRLRSELAAMRKNIHRMDIRLMKRLDKVERHGL